MFKEGNESVSPSYLYSLSSLVTLILLLLISYGYCYFFVKKLPKGIPRLISLLGVFYVLFLAPWYFPSSISFRGLSSFFISWISSFKLVLFSFGKGDLIICDSYVKFVAVAVFPFMIRNESNIHFDETRSKKVQKYTSSRSINNYLLLSESAFQLLALVASMSYFSLSFRDTMMSVLALFVVIHLMMPQCEPIPILKQPYKATSLQNFWGKRWNRVSSNILRHTIYNPTRAIVEDFVGFGPSKIVGLVVTLVVSGIMHEMMFYHMTCGMKPTWEVTKFFVLQGVCMVLEIAAKRFWVRTLRLSPIHSIVTVPLTLGFVLATSYWLVFLPVWRIAGQGCNIKGLGVPLMERLLHNVLRKQ